MPRNQETTNSCCSRFKSTWALAWEQTLTISVDEAGVNVGILEFWQCPACIHWFSVNGLAIDEPIFNYDPRPHN